MSEELMEDRTEFAWDHYPSRTPDYACLTYWHNFIFTFFAWKCCYNNHNNNGGGIIHDKIDILLM